MNNIRSKLLVYKDTADVERVWTVELNGKKRPVVIVVTRKFNHVMNLLT
ncbi:hypothetical protein [Heyndrickxia vini]|uniref:Uncharacterized protein n=1 Tax=Heyndrickxia vini TaxID=1476025 RepID=A0ABX7E133_9BACI|nr:hypothetical protein [Heyndrickxia vini]QQZ08502.1 hypothetical protein I5776_15740 [Heyndrickxia vini]